MENICLSRNFNQLENYLEKVQEKILNEQSLLKLIKITDIDALDKNDLTSKEKLQLMKDNIYDAPINPTQDTVQTLLCIYLDNFSLNNTNDRYKNSFLTIDIFTHKNIVKINEGNRVYKIAGIIDKLLNNSKEFGIGNLEFYNAHWVHFYSKTFVYFQLLYKVIDFN